LDCFSPAPFPRRLAARGGEVLFERIPAIRRQFREQAEQLALQSVEESKSGTIADFYLRELKPLLQRSAGIVSPTGARDGGPVNRLLNRISDVKRYLNGQERGTLEKIADLVRQKDGLDYHYAHQLVLKGLAVRPYPADLQPAPVHSAVHVVLVFAFSGRCPMSEQLPAPDFNSLQYERPNQKWVCGKAADGQACRLGPDSRGRCRVTSECQPAYETKPGESKGRYRCTRPAEYGGPCAGGPLPDGSCCRPLAQMCSGAQSALQTGCLDLLVDTVLTAGLLLVALCGPWRWGIISPGPLSRQHATFTFAHRAKREAAGNCAVCHKAARDGIYTWFQAAFLARPSPWQLRALAAPGPGHDRH
jgi:hypothetical protein